METRRDGKENERHDQAAFFHHHGISFTEFRSFATPIARGNVAAS
jgi:hypothetical protein